MKIKKIIITLVLLLPQLVLAAPSATISTNKNSVEVGESVNATVTVLDTAAWNIKINGSGAATCSTKEADVTSDGKSITKTFNLSCMLIFFSAIITPLSIKAQNLIKNNRFSPLFSNL